MIWHAFTQKKGKAGRFLWGRLILFLFLALLFDTLLLLKLQISTQEQKTREIQMTDDSFRADFFNAAMRASAKSYPAACREAIQSVEEEALCFPVPASSKNPSLLVTFTDSWMGERSYGGTRGHEGTDLMASENTAGLYPVLCMTNGVISNLGWLDKGGYRVGVSTDSGVYYYYAHLDSYVDIREGDRVKAGQLLGFMGDSGYGEEGTTGMFPVHLHIGIYFYTDEGEVSVNPYHVLRYLEKKKLTYSF